MNGLLLQLKSKILPYLLVGVFLITPGSIKELPIPDTTLTATQCLTVNLYYEARGESIKGMKAVAAVVYNRAESRVYPNSICKVIFQNKQFSWTHQQHPKDIYKLLEGDLRHLSNKDKQSYLLAKKVAQMPQKDLQKLLPKGTLWYHSSTVRPRWCKSGIKVAQIGMHIFYKKV